MHTREPVEEEGSHAQGDFLSLTAPVTSPLDL